MSEQTIGIGIVGCGTISGIYLENLTHCPGVAVVAVADIVPERAAAAAARYHVPRAASVAALLANPDVDIVLNLTIPAAHAEVARGAIEAGKSVYNEKPLTVEREDGQALLSRAAARGVRVGGAPDTFLGGGLQTSRRLLDEGAIGSPVAATAFMLCHGHESWHPDPAFYYQHGGGPLFDMGPYYLTALVSHLGPVRRASGAARVSFPVRTITSKPRAGQTIRVETPTHVAALLEFASGPIVTLVTSFDVWHGDVPRIEIYGSEGTLSLPDPNTFGGPVRLRRPGDDAWQEMPLTHANTANARGLGVADLAAALRAGRPARASGELAYHVLDVMHAVLDAARDGRRVTIDSTCERPASLPPGLGPFDVDE